MLQPPKIIVDWGTTNFRAYRFTQEGALVDEHKASCGILSVSDGGFQMVLEREIGSWITRGSEIFLSGMITSRNGWLETPYVMAPARLADLAANARLLLLREGVRLHFLPGVAMPAPLPDVMRGEETQVFGSIAPDETVTLVLPGTHCKWVRVEKGRLEAFRTFITGELFSVLKAHSILGRLIPAEGAPFNVGAFRAGVLQAAAPDSAGLLNDLFSTRSGALLATFPIEEIADRLSGIIIGHEIACALHLGWGAGEIRLVGDAALCDRYETAFAVLARAVTRGPERATVEGFRRLSAEAG